MIYDTWYILYLLRLSKFCCALAPGFLAIYSNTILTWNTKWKKVWEILHLVQPNIWWNKFLWALFTERILFLGKPKALTRRQIKILILFKHFAKIKKTYIYALQRRARDAQTKINSIDNLRPILKIISTIPYKRLVNLYRTSESYAKDVGVFPTIGRLDRILSDFKYMRICYVHIVTYVLNVQTLHRTHGVMITIFDCIYFVSFFHGS